MRVRVREVTKQQTLMSQVSQCLSKIMVHSGNIDHTNGWRVTLYGYQHIADMKHIVFWLYGEEPNPYISVEYQKGVPQFLSPDHLFMPQYCNLIWNDTTALFTLSSGASLDLYLTDLVQAHIKSCEVSLWT